MGDVATRDQGQIVSDIVLKGDLSGLKPVEKAAYYRHVCESLGLNPLTQPFRILRLQGKEILYAQKDATEQLRRKYSVSVVDLEGKQVGDIYVVTAKGQDGKGRTDAATGAVSIANLKGDALANAIMKAETKAKRRLTLSICGLGMLDETELETIPGAATMRIELVDEAAPKEEPPNPPEPTFDARKPKLEEIRSILASIHDVDGAHLFEQDEAKAIWEARKEWPTEALQGIVEQLKEVRNNRASGSEPKPGHEDFTPLLLGDLMTEVF